MLKSFICLLWYRDDDGFWKNSGFEKVINVYCLKVAMGRRLEMKYIIVN
jgi:hypothetical protein